MTSKSGQGQSPRRLWRFWSPRNICGRRTHNATRVKEVNMAQRFELTFASGTKRRYRRWHDTYENAVADAHRVLHDIDER